MEESTQQLGKYTIGDMLGRGAFAAVYRAHDTTLGREVALKILNPVLAADDAWLARFRQEARALASLRHGHIVTVHEIGEADGRLFIAMELIDGPGLNDLIAERGHLPWDETLEILAQVAEALDYAHGRGVIHRDLKPGNILLDPEEGAVLTDFGFAQLVGESSMSVSLSRGIVGTPAYIAPEVWRDQDAQAQSDVYALACIAYEMLTGEVLFAGKNPASVMTKHLIDGAQLPQEWPEGVPEEVGEVLVGALAQDPAARPERSGEFVAQLAALSMAKEEPVPEEVEEPTPAPPIVPPPVTEAPPPAQRRIPGWAWAAGAVALGIVIGILAMRVILPGLAVAPELDPTATWTPAPTSTPVPSRTPVPTDAPTKTPTLMLTQTRTSTPSKTPTLSTTVSSTAKPGRTPTPTRTMKPTPVASPTTASTRLPAAEPTPQLLAPQYGEYRSPITFSWDGFQETSYQVTLHHDHGYVHTSEWIEALTWTFDIPGEEYGNWEWYVTSSGGARSGTGTFVFNPFPGPPRYPLGDANHDCIVDQKDADIVVAHMGETGEPGWIGADVYADGIIDERDYATVITFYGATCS